MDSGEAPLPHTGRSGPTSQLRRSHDLDSARSLIRTALDSGVLVAFGSWGRCNTSIKSEVTHARSSWFPRQVRRAFWRLIATGSQSGAAAIAVGVSRVVGLRWFGEAGGMPPLELSEPSGRYLSMAEREEIAVLRERVSVRVTARGFRNLENFQTAIYFQCGGLQLYPVTATHQIPG